MALRPHTTKPRECSCNRERWVDWDDRDRLVAITSSDGRRVDFAYDALNRRVKKTAAGVETVFVWDGEVLLHDAFSLTENAIFFGARSLRID